MINEVISILFNLGLQKADELWDNWCNEIGKNHIDWSKYIINNDYNKLIDTIKLEFTQNFVNMILRYTNIDKQHYIKTKQFNNDLELPLSSRAFHGPLINIPEYNINFSLNDVWKQMLKNTKFEKNEIYKPEFIARQYAYFTYKTTNKIISGGLSIPVKVIESLPIIKNYILK